MKNLIKRKADLQIALKVVETPLKKADETKNETISFNL